MGMDTSGHGGGDRGIMEAFIKILRNEATPEQVGSSDVFDAIESHYMAFAAEQARIEKKMVKMVDFR